MRRVKNLKFTNPARSSPAQCKCTDRDQQNRRRLWNVGLVKTRLILPVYVVDAEFIASCLQAGESENNRVLDQRNAAGDLPISSARVVSRVRDSVVQPVHIWRWIK